MSILTHNDHIRRRARTMSKGTPSLLSHQDSEDQNTRVLADFSLASIPGSEQEAIRQVTTAVSEIRIPLALLERIKTGVGEAVMNAIEHGNRNRPDLPAQIQVRYSSISGNLIVRVSDFGGKQSLENPAAPNLEAKLLGNETPRGWGMFLIQHMADEVSTQVDGERYCLELTFHNPV